MANEANSQAEGSPDSLREGLKKIIAILDGI